MVLRGAETNVAGDELLTETKKRFGGVVWRAGWTWAVGVSRQEVHTRERWFHGRSFLAELNTNVVLRTRLWRLPSGLRGGQVTGQRLVSESHLKENKKK